MALEAAVAQDDTQGETSASRLDATGQDELRVSWCTRVEYSLPSLALAAVAVMVGTYVPKLYSDTYEVSLESIGYISIAALVFDALSDPAIGFMSDMTRSRWGRRRPFIFLGGCGMAVVALALLSPPSLSPGGLVAWASAFIILIMLTATMLRVPWLALGMELTAGAHIEKTSVFATREIIWILGSVLAAGLPLALGGIDDEAERFRVIGVVVAVVALAVSIACVVTVREPRYLELPARGELGGGFWGGLLFVFTNYWRLLVQIWGMRAGRSLLLTSTVYGGATYLNSFLFAYFVEYAVDAQDKLEVVLITYISCGVLFIPMWVRLAKRFEKHVLLKASMALQSVVLVVAFVAIRQGDFSTYIVLVAFAGMAFGAFSVFKFSMIGDLADADEWRESNVDGSRREGEIQGLFDLLQKLTSAALIGPALITLDAVGYKPNEDQPADAQLVIRLCYALIPGLLGAVSVGLLWPYDLSMARHTELKAAHAARVKASSSLE